LPSVKVLEAKKAEVAAISERLQNACAGVIVDYRGINVADDTVLRKELREAGVEYTVTKNTMIQLAIKGTELEGLSECLEGTTALATSTDDYVAAARILSKFASTHENFNVKSGFLDGEVIGLEKIDSLAKLPSRDILLATVCNAFNAPISAFARAVQAIVDKSGEATAEAAAE
jgi:large subunit ribosomal protein L10